MPVILWKCTFLRTRQIAVKTWIPNTINVHKRNDGVNISWQLFCDFSRITTAFIFTTQFYLPLQSPKKVRVIMSALIRQHPLFSAQANTHESRTWQYTERAPSDSHEPGFHCAWWEPPPFKLIWQGETRQGSSSLCIPGLNTCFHYYTLFIFWQTHLSVVAHIFSC